MAPSRYSSHSIFWLVFSLCVSLGFTSDVYGNELAQRSNSSFYGGVALWQTIVETTDVCPSDTQTCSQGLGTCCPEGTYCEDSGWFCCPIDVDCSAVVKAAPVCADPSWGLYEATGNGDVLFCCLPGTSGLAGSGCEANSAFASGGASLAMATSITQVAHASKTSTPTGGSGSATGTGTGTTQASSTPTKNSANRVLSDSFSALISCLLIAGFAV